MPQAMNAVVRKVIKPAHLVTVKETRTTTVYEGSELIDTKTENTARKEWRVLVVVDEDFVGEKQVTLSRHSEEEAKKLVEGAVVYHF